MREGKMLEGIGGKIEVGMLTMPRVECSSIKSSFFWGMA